jgi:fermentation-respiration switch protein FrsA (DUF1100 family)
MVTTVLEVLIGGGALYLLLNLYALLISDKLLFTPRESSYRHLPDETRIRSDNGTWINTVFLKHPEPRCTLLFSHGNTEDLGNVVPFMKQFYDRGYSVFMYDYRGYGTSEGHPSTRHAQEDATAAYRWLVEEEQIDPRTIVSHGRSLGGAVAVWLAAHHETGGLITEVSFASAFRVKTRWKLLFCDKFDSLKAIRHVNAPVLVIHGTDDDIIPFRHGKKIFNAAAEPKQHLWIEKGRHMNYAYVDEAQYFQTIERFIDELVSGATH